MRGSLEQRLEYIGEIDASQRTREALALADVILAEGGSYELARHMDQVDWFHAAVIAEVQRPGREDSESGPGHTESAVESLNEGAAGWLLKAEPPHFHSAADECQASVLQI